MTILNSVLNVCILALPTTRGWYLLIGARKSNIFQVQIHWEYTRYWNY